jgi:hypothetical protein
LSLLKFKLLLNDELVGYIVVLTFFHYPPLDPFALDPNPPRVTVPPFDGVPDLAVVPPGIESTPPVARLPTAGTELPD